MPTAVKEQLGFDEQVIEDDDVEKALEERLKRKNSLDAVRKVFDGADTAARAELQKLELPEGGVARVGRFRITHTVSTARSVAFETKSKSRIRIATIEDDAAAAG